MSHHHALPLLPGLFLCPHEAGGVSQHRGSPEAVGAVEASAQGTPALEGRTSTSTSLRKKQRAREAGPKASPADPRGVLSFCRPCSGQQSISAGKVGRTALHRGGTAPACARHT